MEVRLLDFPVELFEQTTQHMAALQREIDVIRSETPDPSRPPDRLVDLVEELDHRFVGYRTTMEMLAALVAEGADREDVVIPVLGDPEAAAGAVERLRDLLVEVDDYSAAGGLLITPPTPSHLLGFRQWLFEQVVGQLRGAQPAPWPNARPRDPVPPVVVVDGAERVIVRPTGSIDLSTAATLRTSIFDAHGGGGDVTVDLTGVEFVDSVGLSVLVAAHQRFVADGRSVDFVVPGHLLRTFEITGLTQVLLLRPGN